MITFPNAKINIGLHIRGKRADGYHNIESLMLPVMWCDVLEILPAMGSEDSIKVHGDTGITADGDNLCMKAVALARKEFGIPAVEILLYKNIPSGAGLGGGSSDAAFTLRMINEIFRLSLDQDKLFDLAMQLGSDCGFFIHNEIAKVSGRGEIIELLDKRPPKMKLLIAVPQGGISTTKAYDAVEGKYNDHPLETASVNSPELWQQLYKNDFELFAFREIPQILKIKEGMLNSGALYSSMSGSGSAVFGVYEKETRDIPEFPLCKTWIGYFA